MKRTVIHWPSRTERHLISGNSFAIDQRLERRGVNIFLDRTYVHHAQIAAVRSILLPRLHLWVLFFDGHRNDPPYKCYMHMAQISDQGNYVTIDDLYLDVIIEPDSTWRVLDIDEFRQAVAAQELSAEQIQAALLGLENGCHLVARSNGDVEAYLRDQLASE